MKISFRWDGPVGENVAQAMDRGWIHLNTPLGVRAKRDRFIYGLKCDEHRLPEVVVIDAKRFTSMSVDMAPTGLRLPDRARVEIAELIIQHSIPACKSEKRLHSKDLSLRLGAYRAHVGESMVWAYRIQRDTAESVATELTGVIKRFLKDAEEVLP